MPIILYSDKRKYLIKDTSKDFHCAEGLIRSTDLIKSKPGDFIKTNKDVEFIVLEPMFVDMYRKIKRGAQIIPRKDIGLIITECGLTKDSVIIETGAGSGATGMLLSKICKKVYSYEIREDYCKLVNDNLELLDIKNMKLYNKDAKLGFKEKNVDLVILDLPDPWEVIEHAKKALKPGGFIVSYSPTIPQVMDFVEAIDKDLEYIKTSEINEREWDVAGRKVRPRSQAIGHSGFMTFARKLR